MHLLWPFLNCVMHHINNPTIVIGNMRYEIFIFHLMNTQKSISFWPRRVIRWNKLQLTQYAISFNCNLEWYLCISHDLELSWHECIKAFGRDFWFDRSWTVTGVYIPVDKVTVGYFPIKELGMQGLLNAWSTICSKLCVKINKGNYQ